ncbi:MAG: DUF4358 domain-containing protein [Anaerorhabdus sp.]
MRKFLKLILSLFIVSTLFACSKKEEKVVIDLDATMESVIAQGETLGIPATAPLTKEEFCTLFGVNQDDVVAANVTRAMMSAHLNDIIMVEVSDGKISDVKDAINNFYDNAVLYPFMMEFVENKQVFESGNYLIVVVAEKSVEIMDFIKEEIK